MFRWDQVLELYYNKDVLYSPEEEENEEEEKEEN